MIEALVVIGIHVVKLVEDFLSGSVDLEKCLIDVECLVEVPVNHDVKVSALDDRIGRAETLARVKYECADVVSALAEGDWVRVGQLVRHFIRFPEALLLVAQLEQLLVSEGDL